PIFQGISQSASDLIKISSLLIPRKIRAGEFLIRQGETSEEMFILLKGEVSIICNDQVIAKVGEGRVIGEIGFFNQSKRTATVKATTDLELLVIHRSDFLHLMKHDKDLVMRFSFGV